MNNKDIPNSVTILLWSNSFDQIVHASLRLPEKYISLWPNNSLFKSKKNQNVVKKDESSASLDSYVNDDLMRFEKPPTQSYSIHGVNTNAIEDELLDLMENQKIGWSLVPESEVDYVQDIDSKYNLIKLIVKLLEAGQLNLGEIKSQSSSTMTSIKMAIEKAKKEQQESLKDTEEDSSFTESLYESSSTLSSFN